MNEAIFESRTARTARVHNRVGTLAVRTYTASWTGYVEERINGLVLPFNVKTKGPTHRYQSVLFVESEM